MLFRQLSPTPVTECSCMTNPECPVKCIRLNNAMKVIWDTIDLPMCGTIILFQTWVSCVFTANYFIITYRECAIYIQRCRFHSLSLRPCGLLFLSWPPSQLHIINGAIHHERHTNEHLHQSYYACRIVTDVLLLFHFLLIVSARF